jgi:hypothetical protein
MEDYIEFVARLNSVSISSIAAPADDDQIRALAFALHREQLRALVQRVAFLESEIRELRTTAPEHPITAGQHPYRTPAAAAPGSPVVASMAPERPEGRPGIARRVWAALASRWYEAGLVATCAAALYGAAVNDKLTGFGGILAGGCVAALFAACEPRSDP